MELPFLPSQEREIIDCKRKSYRKRIISALTRPMRPLHVEILELQLDLSAEGRDDVPIAPDPVGVPVRVAGTGDHT